MDQFDKKDKQTLSALISEAKSCASNYDFSCADRKLKQAKNYIVSPADKKKISSAESYVSDQRYAYEQANSRWSYYYKDRMNFDDFFVIDYKFYKGDSYSHTVSLQVNYHRENVTFWVKDKKKGMGLVGTDSCNLEGGSYFSCMGLTETRRKSMDWYVNTVMERYLNKYY
jgi:hypothetical protein